MCVCVLSDHLTPVPLSALWFSHLKNWDFGQIDLIDLAGLVNFERCEVNFIFR